MEVLVFLWVGVGFMLVVGGLFDVFVSGRREGVLVGWFGVLAGLFFPVFVVGCFVVFLFVVVRESLKGEKR